MSWYTNGMSYRDVARKLTADGIPVSHESVRTFVLWFREQSHNGEAS